MGNSCAKVDLPLNMVIPNEFDNLEKEIKRKNNIKAQEKLIKIITMIQDRKKKDTISDLAIYAYLNELCVILNNVNKNKINVDEFYKYLK